MIDCYAFNQIQSLISDEISVSNTVIFIIDNLNNVPIRILLKEVYNLNTKMYFETRKSKSSLFGPGS